MFGKHKSPGMFIATAVWTAILLSLNFFILAGAMMYVTFYYFHQLNLRS